MAAKEEDEDAEEEDWTEKSELDESAASGSFRLGGSGSRQQEDAEMFLLLRCYSLSVLSSFCALSSSATP